MSASFTWKTTAEEAAKTFANEIKGKTVLVTGVSNRSLGQETVRVLAPYAKTIIVASRSKERVDAALEGTRKENPSVDIRFVTLDLASEKSIRAAAAEVLALNLPINVVINNAAVPQYDTLVRTEQGFEAQVGANHLGHFLFNSLIFPAIRAGASAAVPARVVTVSSVAVHFTDNIRWDDLTYQKRPEEYSKYPAYAESKAANVLFSQELAKRYASENILAFALHPGAVWDTVMGAAMPEEDLIKFGLKNPDGTVAKEGISKTIPEGTATQITAAFDPVLVSHSGAYLDDSIVHNDRLPAHLQDPANAPRFWELSEQIWNEKFDAAK